MEEIKRDLNDTKVILEKNIYKMVIRGYEIEKIEMDSNVLVESSNKFIRKVDRSRCRCCSLPFYSWWWCLASQERSGHRVVLKKV